MRRQICLIWLLIVYAAAIRVAVEDKDVSTTTVVVNETSPTPDAPIYYESDEPEIDSYLIPPNTHTSAEDKQDLIPTYLLPPTQEKQEDFYSLPANTGTQSDWYPIQQSALQNNPNILAQSLQQHPHVITESQPQHPHILTQSLPQSHSFILPQAQQEAIPILMLEETPPPRFNVENTRKGKVHQFQHQLETPIPSRHLEPPLESAENHFLLPTPSVELELPYQEQQQQFIDPSEEAYELPIMGPNDNFNPLQTNKPLNFRFKPAEPTLSLHLTPPKPLLSKHKNPTKLYPKKYPGGFKPVPIPISQFAEESLSEVPKAKPVKPFNPSADSETEYSKPTDKETYLYEKAKQKRKLRKEKAAKLQQQLPVVEEPTVAPTPPAEQDTSETHFRYPGRNAYPAPLRQAPPTAPPRPHSLSAPSKSPPPGDRTEFRMHGMKGPHSYQFGFDTGKGGFPENTVTERSFPAETALKFTALSRCFVKNHLGTFIFTNRGSNKYLVLISKNRQFRFEERDNDGHVRGHYGYVDKRGKMRVVNYDADPLLGFRADAPVETEP